MEENISELIHFMKAVENPEWMIELVENLAEYAKAKEQGLLLKLPCKVGTTVYLIQNYLDCEYGYNCPLDCASGRYNCEINFPCEHEYKRFRITEKAFDIDMINSINKTVFLTKEEAENALINIKK